MTSPFINIIHSLEIVGKNHNILTTLKAQEMQEAPKDAISPTLYSVLIFIYLFALFKFLPIK